MSDPNKIILSEDDGELFMKTLANPPPVNDYLAKALEEYYAKFDDPRWDDNEYWKKNG